MQQLFNVTPTSSRRTHADWKSALQKNIMEILKNGTLPSVKGPEDWFTGSVRIDPLFQKKEVTKLSKNHYL